MRKSIFAELLKFFQQVLMIDLSIALQLINNFFHYFIFFLIKNIRNCSFHRLFLLRGHGFIIFIGFFFLRLNRLIDFINIIVSVFFDFLCLLVHIVFIESIKLFHLHIIECFSILSSMNIFLLEIYTISIRINFSLIFID